jgi:hypothetical protein
LFDKGIFRPQRFAGGRKEKIARANPTHFYAL